MLWWPRDCLAALSKGLRCLFSSAILGCIDQLYKIEQDMFLWDSNNEGRASAGGQKDERKLCKSLLLEGLFAGKTQ